jgi:hypothetical protein
MPTRDRLADETKQFGKSYCNNGQQINITMLMFVNSKHHPTLFMLGPKLLHHVE